MPLLVIYRSITGLSYHKLGIFLIIYGMEKAKNLKKTSPIRRGQSDYHKESKDPIILCLTHGQSLQLPCGYEPPIYRKYCADEF